MLRIRHYLLDLLMSHSIRWTLIEVHANMDRDLTQVRLGNCGAIADGKGFARDGFQGAPGVDDCPSVGVCADLGEMGGGIVVLDDGVKDYGGSVVGLIDVREHG